ncbi:lytic transglycosylase domain-containing protein [Kitasatospora sp. GAS204B]|uniref:lytic transglycosylase domain-containing protein n=1 Tax=unclassified Kitasatospora TaxID=2633591 RepID=UPI002476740C|nr:transglycosylase SLT domain-containing protein [Kitasatospora sp. GAS204B]MDH6115770.1 soluble lytic murein transglycosylase-like protein [Kitasatospora sp. GAS204B]
MTVGQATGAGKMRIGNRQKVAAGLIAVTAAGALTAYGITGSGHGHRTATAGTVTVADGPSASASLTASPTASASASDPAAPSPSASASLTASPSATSSAGPSRGASHSPAPSASRATTPSGAQNNAAPATSAAPPAKPQAPAPAPTTKPGPVAPPPPAAAPGVPPLQSSCKPSYTGTNAADADVAAALTAAAGKARTLTLGSGGTDRMPALPVNLVKAVAWQESGWQSTILACDGGIGTMQIMPATAPWMNGKFGTKNDVQTLAGNTDLGAELLDELVAYYGDSDFGGTYDLTPDPTTGKNPLLDLVIAAYNAGAGNVHYNTVTDPSTGVTTGSSVIPNPGYVAAVEALMTTCPCMGH